MNPRFLRDANVLHLIGVTTCLLVVAASALADETARIADRMESTNMTPPWNADSLHGTPPPVLYLNRCEGNCTVLPGNDDAITNRSSLVGTTRILPEFAYSDESWNTLKQCVRRVYSEYRVTVTDIDPGNVPHRELMIGGTPGNLGMSNGIMGVSPWACGVPIPNAIAFVFSAAHPDETAELCWTATHEAGHLFGLDHEFHEPDSMTYAALTTQFKHFTDFDSECFDQNTGQQTPCNCGAGAIQNTDLALATLLGRDRVFGDGMGEDPWELPPPAPLTSRASRTPLSCGTRTDRATALPATW